MSEALQEDLSDPNVFVLLGKRRRRLILRILQESTPPLTTMELAKRIGEREYETPAANEFNTIYINLHHNHLPRFDDADVVVYNRTEGIIRLGRNFEALNRVLEGMAARTDFSVGDRCPRCEASVMVRIAAAGCEQPVCLRCERELRGVSPVP